MATKLPSFDQLMSPLIRALQALGGSGSVQEIYDKVVELERVPDDVLAQLHDPEKSNLTEIAYRLAWARTYLKKYGLLENSSRGIWSLNQRGKDADKLDPQRVVQPVRALDKKGKRSEPGEIAAAKYPGCRGFRRAGMQTKATHRTHSKSEPSSI
jgi:restriction system protein